jgi:NitT/TauT family transport system substrate-binding protein
VGVRPLGGVAGRDGIELNAFRLDDYGVPYGYTPVLLARPETIAESGATLAAFLAATRRGYEDAATDPDAAAERLLATAEGPGLDDEPFVRESQRRIADYYSHADADADPDAAPEERWGWMRHERWAAFVDWLAEEGILQSLDGDHLPADAVDPGSLYTTELLAGESTEPT